MDRYANLPGFKLSTLLYCFNAADEILLMERTQEPNRGLWSPPGGKLETGVGESPHACASREAKEELGIESIPADFHLTGLISETNYQGGSHWLMFLFELRRPLTLLPALHREGRFQFFRREELDRLPLPESDRAMIWPLFWKYRHGFFAAHCDCSPDGDRWRIDQK